MIFAVADLFSERGKEFGLNFAERLSRVATRFCESRICVFPLLQFAGPLLVCSRILLDQFVEDSILFDGVEIGREAVVRRAILDKNVHVPAGATVGVDAEQDRQRGFTVTDDGLTVIGRDMVIPS